MTATTLRHHTARLCPDGSGDSEYAAANGTVEAVVDGKFDRNTVWAGQPPNYITIITATGWRTHYFHLMKNSIAVKTGDAVVAGHLLGLVGSFGNSTGPTFTLR